MSLTKKNLLSQLACDKPEKLEGEFFGEDLYVRPVSEFKRSRRLAELLGKDGNPSRDGLQRARVMTIIDHLCDKDGQPIFDERDLADLLEMDALKLDLLTSAIESWVSEREKKFITA